MLKFIIVIIVLISLNACRGNNVGNTSSYTLNDYLSSLTHVPLGTDLDTITNQHIFSVKNVTHIRQLDVSFYTDTQCSRSKIIRTISLKPLHNTPFVLPVGKYITTDNSNFALMLLYENGSTHSSQRNINSIGFTQNDMEPPYAITYCLNGDGLGERFADYQITQTFDLIQHVSNHVNNTAIHSTQTRLVKTFCPAHQYLCPSQNFCTSNLSNCSNRCPVSAPIICMNGSCVANIAACSKHSISVTCSFHHCQLSQSYDISNDVSDKDKCPSDKIMCPRLSGDNIICATNIAECPRGVICPLNRQVRCLDSTCAFSASDCPVVPSHWSGSRILCPDGAWASSLAECGTPTVCPLHIPYKCWDDTCRKNPEDCPPSTRCPNITPHLCPSGACVSTMDECRSGNFCPSTTPIKCPDQRCVASVKQCPISNSLATPYHCANGELVSDPYLCFNPTTAACPVNLPIKCVSGECVDNEHECPLNCTTTRNPFYCIRTRSCVSSKASCTEAP